RAELSRKTSTTSMEDDPMPSIIDHLTEIYVFIDDHLKQHPEKAQWRQSNNAEPAFSDAEVLTIGLSQSALGLQSLKEGKLSATVHDCSKKSCTVAESLRHTS